MAEDTPELFESTDRESEPLAARMRPRTLEELVGQDHILGPGRLLRRAIAADQLSSLIFSGPPGSGKTTIARIIANTTKSRFAALNAVLTGVAELRKEIQTADHDRRFYGRRTILFVDEVHRWNKAQQDALLPWVENGTVVLIGATTENPFFEVNDALVSRSRIFQLTRLTDEELRRVCRQALSDRERGYGAYDVRITEDALEHLVRVADGDARSLLNALQLAVETTPDRFPPHSGEPIEITLPIAEESIQRKALLYDRDGDYHYDTISAFIKSLRGSDPDAALYWLARMIRAGEDPRFLFRRMLISASEDIGLADPHALPHTVAAAEAFDRVGMPEGAFHLAQAALYLATAEKSNATLGYFDAANAVEQEQSQEVPRHLRDDNRDREGFKHGEGYLYPHAYREHWVAQNYLPAPLRGRLFYRPSSRGYEGRLRNELERRREAQLATAFYREADEVLTFTPHSSQREQWLRRASGEISRRVAARREALFEAAAIARHMRVLVLGETPSALLWEAVRSAPEGLVAAVIADESERRSALAYAEQFSEFERPQILNDLGQARAFVGEATDNGFERVLAANLLLRTAEKAQAAGRLREVATPEARIVLLEEIPSDSTRLSTVLAERGLSPTLVEALQQAEAELFADPRDARFANRPEILQQALQQAGLRLDTLETVTFGGERIIPRTLLERWFPAPPTARSSPTAHDSPTADGSPVSEAPEAAGGMSTRYAHAIRTRLDQEGYRELRAFALSTLADRAVQWSSTAIVLTAFNG